MAGFSCQRYQESYLSREICVHFIRTLFLPSSSLLCNLELGKYKELFESEVIHPSSSLVSLVLSTVVMSKPSLPAEPSLSNEKQADLIKTDEESMTGPDNLVLHNERDIVTQIISVHDDPSLNPWTFRSLFIGIGLSAFGGILGEHQSLRRRSPQLMNYDK